MKITVDGIEYDVANELEAYRLVCDGKTPQELDQWLTAVENLMVTLDRRIDIIEKNLAKMNISMPDLFNE